MVYFSFGDVTDTLDSSHGAISQGHSINFNFNVNKFIEPSDKIGNVKWNSVVM